MNAQWAKAFPFQNCPQFRCHYYRSWVCIYFCYFFLPLFLASLFYVVFFFLSLSTTLCFGVVKCGPYHLFCVIHSVIVFIQIRCSILQLSLLFCFVPLFARRCCILFHWSNNSIVQIDISSFIHSIDARSQSQNKNDREACFSLDNHYCFRLWYSCGSYIFNLLPPSRC